MSVEELCPCGSGVSYRDCTGPLHRPMGARSSCDCRE
ncbi:MAG: SEC-C domain-containing protein [Thaumarchaeota archaeon]|nr:SEC-C domain-containing protein [Nitrososphaerota archaeon]